MQSEELVAVVKEQIFKKRPVLRGIFNASENIPIKDYADSVIVTKSVVDDRRKEEFIAALSAEVERHFSKEIVESVARQMDKSYCVSTAEHHGPLTHPYFVYSNLLTIGQGLDNTIILSVGNVSMTNSSYPRGLIFHSSSGLENRISFFPAKNRLSPVFGHRPFGQAELEAFFRKIKLLEIEGRISIKLATRVQQLVIQVYGESEVLGKTKFSDQITLSNSKLWEYFFSSSSLKLPRLIMIQLEDVVLRLLKTHHLFFPSEISELLFNTNARNMLLKYFDGIPGNFSLKEKKGTFLFWALPQGSSQRQQLWLDGNYLRSDQGYSLELEPNALEKAMERRELIPSMFLSSLLLSEYYGVKCLGGFSQGTYLTAIHDAYVQFRGASAREFDPSHTTGLRSDFVLGYFEDTSGKWHGASGVDLALSNSSETWEILSEGMKLLTLEEAMAPLFVDLYKELYKPKEQDIRLLNLNVDDIINYYGIRKKIRPCIQIKS